MRISPISVMPANQSYTIQKKAVKSESVPSFNQSSDSVSFKGWRGAGKGFTVMGALGAIAGAIVSGGTSVIPTIIYFAACNGAIGAFAGHHIEEESDL